VRVAFVKQLLDSFGPWSSVRWQETTPKDIFKIWPSRATYLQTAILLKADWYIVPQQINTEYTFDAILGHAGAKEMLTEHTVGVVAMEDVPFEDYDLVMTLDPILKAPRRIPTVFAYHMNEHWDISYYRSLHKPIRGYDLFLAHMLDAPQNLDRLPQAISFPYLWDAHSVRAIFDCQNKHDRAWVDWRTLAVLGMSVAQKWSSEAEAAAQRLEKALNFPVSFRGFRKELYSPTDAPLWGDAERYLAELAQYKYYISVGRGSGAGQGLIDAASLGAICFGEEDKPYHRLVCHPACLCADMVELPGKFRAAISNPGLHSEIIGWQDAKLRKFFSAEPLTLLQRAIEMKRDRF
jgi:hypothetical protein